MYFFDTVAGQRFTEGTVPLLVREISRLSEQIERLNENLEQMNKAGTKVEAEKHD